MQDQKHGRRGPDDLFGYGHAHLLKAIDVSILVKGGAIKDNPRLRLGGLVG